MVLVFVAVVFSMKINNNNINIKSAQDMMRLLSVPQKSKAFPQNVFKFNVGERLFVGSYSWSNCNISAPVKVNSLTISPDPISLKGDITVGFNANIGVNVAAPLKAKLKVEKSVFGIKVEVPCVDNIGSCDYDDVCSMLPPTPSSGCPPPLPTYKIPCACPVPKGVYNLPASKFAIPDIPLPGWLASGDYFATVQAYDQAGVNLACYKLEISLA